MNFERDILPLKDIVFRTALRITMNREEAEDIVQDTLLRLWERRNELSKIQNIEAFALTSARNLALDRMQQASHRNIPLIESVHDTHSDVSPHELMERREQHAAINSIIESLPEKQRTVFHLRDIEGRSYSDIASIMHISESDVKVTLHRARMELRKSLKE